MRIKSIALYFSFALILFTVTSVNALSVWEKASLDVERLSPDQFKQLPSDIISDLKKRGCTIPQVSLIPPTQNSGGLPHNVIRGEFITEGQADFAVLCSINEMTSILVYEDAKTDKIHELSKSEDVNWIQGMGQNTYMYSRRIIPTKCESINTYYGVYTEYGPEKPPECTHEGIEEIFEDKASLIYFYYNYDNRWLNLSGAD